jgi:hypothetical protein
MGKRRQATVMGRLEVKRAWNGGALRYFVATLMPLRPFASIAFLHHGGPFCLIDECRKCSLRLFRAALRKRGPPREPSQTRQERSLRPARHQRQDTKDLLLSKRALAQIAKSGASIEVTEG